jgi:serine/tyrosine/threonine adenylyltransferase
MHSKTQGAGRTPYSRSADGRAVLRSSLREFVASEAMAALGVPTTRALSLVRTNDAVIRDMFYSGDIKPEPGAVVCRVARCFVRFGTFQLPVSRGENGGEMLTQLVTHVVTRHYPHLKPAKGPVAAAAPALLREVAVRTGRLFSEWLRVGFVHGVLNTDKMSIIGDTIDYGPYAFMERFDPDFTPNTTDLPGRRYCYRAQPEIGQFNLLQLARSLAAVGLVTEDQAGDSLAAYAEELATRHEEFNAKKLGLKAYDKSLAVELLKLMYEDDADFTNTFRSLGLVASKAEDGEEDGMPLALTAVLDPLPAERRAAWGKWVALWRTTLRAEGRPDAERQAEQNAINPAIIPRNHGGLTSFLYFFLFFLSFFYFFRDTACHCSCVLSPLEIRFQTTAPLVPPCSHGGHYWQGGRRGPRGPEAVYGSTEETLQRRGSRSSLD